MIKKLAKYLVLLILACAEFKATPEAGIRRRATARLRMCLDEPPFRPMTDKPCLKENREWCTEQHMERDCGLDGMFGNSPGFR